MRYAAKNPFSYVHANIGGQVALFETIKVRKDAFPRGYESGAMRPAAPSKHGPTRAPVQGLDVISVCSNVEVTLPARPMPR